MVSVLVVGATRGLGASLAKRYASQAGTTVYATARASSAPDGFPDGVRWLHGVDLTRPDVGDALADQLRGLPPLDVVVITAGRFTTEDFSSSSQGEGGGKGPNWEEEVTMYTTSAIAPVFVVHRLFHAGLLARGVGAGGGEGGGGGAKVVLVSSESGSIALRHESEGGGNYAHHASKAALNMTGRLLSLDLREAGVVVSIVHPGFMRTEMTKGVGFDKFWDDGGGECVQVYFALPTPNPPSPNLFFSYAPAPARKERDVGRIRVCVCVWACAYQSYADRTADADGTACVVAVTPDEAAESLVEWTEKLDMSKTGEYWAPRGPRE